MDYREALERKVFWEKEMKPSIKKLVFSLKEKILNEEEEQNELKEYLRKLKQARPYYIEMINSNRCAISIDDIDEEIFDDIMEMFMLTSDKEMSLEHYDRNVKRCEYKINSNPTRIKCMKKELCMISNIYNGNLEFAVENFHRFKDEAYKCIEDVDGLVEYAIYNINGEESEKEGGYNEYCKMFKREIKFYEELIEDLSLLKGEVKQILKANRRANKRMN